LLALTIRIQTWVAASEGTTFYAINFSVARGVPNGTPAPPALYWRHQPARAPKNMSEHHPRFSPDDDTQDDDAFLDEAGVAA
jgi:hypothetical protein